MSMLVSTHVHLDKLLLVERNRNLESNFSYEVDSESDDAIKLNKVSFSFINSDNNFYEKIDLSFEKNKHHVITGVNGSGKSTLLGILSGALLPFEGSATKNTDKIGYIGASPLILEDTLRANLKYASKDEISDDEMMVLLDEFKVFSENTIDKLDEIITNKTLSSGQMQKVSFIRAFLSNCEILFLDESTANLDVQTKKQISDILSTKEITIINSTHNPEDFVFDKHLKITINNNDKRIIESL
jgi:ABC-type transport system involved in cytochrome bd biosynthesis fused ATPase/permease subunit